MQLRLLPVLPVLLFLGLPNVLHGQAKTTASRRFDLQVGAGFTVIASDYDLSKLKGGAVYATLDFTPHFGGEFVIHQAGSGNGDQIYERTYELGGRYFRDYGRYKPYLKAMYGRGVFNYRDGVANLAYNEFAGGVGVDIALKPYLNVRLDYEYQNWRSFPPNGLDPQTFTIGAAYHFPGGLQRGRHF